MISIAKNHTIQTYHQHAHEDVALKMIQFGSAFSSGNFWTFCIGVARPKELVKQEMEVDRRHDEQLLALQQVGVDT